MNRSFQTEPWILLRRFLLPGLSLLTGRDRFAIYRKIRTNEWLSSDEIKALQLERLQKVLTSAKNNVPYYREKLGHTDLSTPNKAFEAFQLLPFITKSFIQQNHEKMVSDYPYKKPPRISYTGGSTGELLKIVNDWSVYEEMEACTMRALSWGGWGIGDPVAMFWGGLRDLPSKKSLNARVKEKINGRYILGTYRYDDEIMSQWIRFLSDNKIQFIYGYASILASLARFVKRRGIPAPRIKAAYSTAETLFPQFRLDIEEAFQCKVYDQYGSREVISVASECERGGMHILADMAYLEFVSEGNSSEISRLVITSFANPALPFIRYDIGDYGSQKNESCQCGRGFPLMEMRIGRRNDHILLSNGKIIYPSYFIHLLDGIKGIQSFQFRQIDQGTMTLKIQKGPDWTPDNEYLVGNLETKIYEDLVSRINLNIQYVDEILIPASGKHRYVMSDLIKSQS